MTTSSSMHIDACEGMLGVLGGLQGYMLACRVHVTKFTVPEDAFIDNSSSDLTEQVNYCSF